MENKNSVYIAMTIDGFIADKKGSVSFLDKYNESSEDYGYSEFSSSVDTVVMGNNTYKQFAGEKEFIGAYKDMIKYVFTETPGKPKDDFIFTNEDVTEFSKRLKGHTWLMGGAYLINRFLEKGLIDELIIAVMPEIIGSGIRLFAEIEFSQSYKLLSSKNYPDGVVMLHYSK